MTQYSVLWWSAHRNAELIPCESLEEARGLVQHIEARGPYRARVEVRS